jgi:hypothetical protein
MRVAIYLNDQRAISTDEVADKSLDHDLAAELETSKLSVA